jgi:outer membrane receptor protein involved in Fe transport
LLNDRLHLLLGGRFDYVKEKVLFITPTLNFKGSRSDTAFSWRAGALYELTD